MNPGSRNEKYSFAKLNGVIHYMTCVCSRVIYPTGIHCHYLWNVWDSNLFTFFLRKHLTKSWNIKGSSSRRSLTHLPSASLKLHRSDFTILQATFWKHKMQDTIWNRTAARFVTIKLKDSSESTVFKIIKRQTDAMERMHLSSKGLPQVRSAVPYELGRPRADGFYPLQAQRLAPGRVTVLW